MDLGLKNKAAIVLGGGRGIGRGIARALSAEGARLVIISRIAATIASAAAEISAETGGQVIAIGGDQSDPSSIAAAIGAAQAELGTIDILVNNGGGPPMTGASDVPADQWRAYFDQMVLSTISVTDLVLPGMRAAGWGRILTVASSGVIEPLPMIGMSNTLRSALIGWSKTLAGEVGKDGITVNILLPGSIASERLQEVDKRMSQRTGQNLEATIRDNLSRIPIGRYGTVDEFGAVAAFIASNQASYITGSMIRIDGGAIRSV